MAGRTGVLTVSATGRGPVYSVVGRDGEVRLAGGTLEDLRRVDPMLYRQVRTGLVRAGDEEEGLDYQLSAGR
jgi:hypothetical protein